jgi:uncharacterized protein
MTTPVGLSLGAPGVYPAPPLVEPEFHPIRLDVCGFVGVALRGPVDEPVLVSSWTDYQRRFGGFESPDGRSGPDRLLPYAVSAFFAQGGQRAYVVRVAPPTASDDTDDDAAEAATARYRFPLEVTGGGVDISAADEGSWGDRLALRLEYEITQSFPAAPRPRASGDTETRDLRLTPGVIIPAGTLLRLRRGDLPPGGAFRWVVDVADRRTDAGSTVRVAVLGEPVGMAGVAEAAVVTAALVADDGDASFPRHERIAGLGLHPSHPRYAGVVLATESLLARPSGTWTAALTPPDALLAPVAAERVHAGADRWDGITGSSFFDGDPANADPLDELPHRGVDAIGRVGELGLLCAPDLTWSWPEGSAVRDVPERRRARPAFGPCEVPQAQLTYPATAAPTARLDPLTELPQIIDRQQRLIDVAELRRTFVALLDVPPGLPVDEIIRWRAHFDSSYAAAYHPWLAMPRLEARGGPAVRTPPSAFAAGIIAARERRFGLPWGPANELAVGAVELADAVTDAVHDRLHLLGVNVYRAERDGFRLSAARTLSSDPQYRQLTVRRLMSMLALTVYRQAQWLVFEPNNAGLRSELGHALTALLRGLQRQGAFAGATEADSFFVRCDDELNPPASRASGRLIAEVGVAPSSALEYLVLRIAQDADGRVQVEAGGG